MQEQRVATANANQERYKVVYRVAIEAVRPMLRSQADAEDVAQETWIAVDRALKRLDDPDQIRNFEAWVRRIAVNRAINLYKSRWARVLRSQGEPADELNLPSQDRSPEESYQLREYENRLADAVSELPEQFGRCFALHYRGHSYEEIGRLLGSPVGTVKARVHRAREKLAALLDSKPDGSGEGGA